MNALLFGLGAGFGVSAWRSVPPLQPTPRAALLVWVTVALLVAYGAGRGRRPSSATATAVASAVATSTAASVGNSVHLHIGAGDPVDLLQTAPWRSAPVPLQVQYARAIDHHEVIDGEDLDDIDPVEVLDRS